MDSKEQSSQNTVVSGKKLRKGKKKEDWKKWKEVIDGIFSDTSEIRDKMKKHYNMFLGKIWNEKELTDEDSKIVFNLLFSIVEAQAPLLTDNNPIPTVVPHFDFMEKVADMYNKGIKYLWENMEMQAQTLKALIYAMTKKIGIFKIYFDPQFKDGQICCDVVDPVSFFIAPGYTDVWKAPFCGVREKKPMSWIRANFPDVKGVKCEASVFDDEKRDAFQYDSAEDYELDVRMATVYEVFVRSKEYVADYPEFDEESGKYKEYTDETIDNEAPYGKYIYFTKDTFLGEKAATDKHSLPPYVTVVDYVDPGSFLGIDEVDQTEGLIKELNLLYQALVKYAHKHLDPSYEYDESLGTDRDDIQERLHKGGQIFSKMGADRLLTQVIEPIQNPTVAGLFTMLPDIIEEMSGITDVSKGEASKKQRQSASEIAILLESSHTRIRQKVRNLEQSLRRVCYLFVRLMQQHYDEPKRIFNRLDQGYSYSTIQNSKAFAAQTIASPQQVENGAAVATGQKKPNEVEPGDLQAYEDYKNFMEAFENIGDLDPVYFDFDIQIDTNSTLPLDKQTLANMVIRLAQMKLVDREAVLDTLNFPNREEIMSRMDEKEQQMAGGGGKPSPSVQQFMKETGTPPPPGGIPPGLGE